MMRQNRFVSAFVVCSCAMFFISQHSGCGGETNAAPTPEHCGDGVVNANELCDDGNNLSGDGCSGDCLSDETCGNSIVDLAVGEACDDGNTVDGDGCSAACSLPSCGDDVVDSAEVCDDGNAVDGDGCNATCTSDEICGNGVVDVVAGEVCDDGNTTAGDGCTPDCLIEFCGNGTIDPDEVCDDGNHLDGDGCSSNCRSNETCGNGVVDALVGETCDDGNTTDGDGCRADCTSPFCGNQEVDPGEQCDDGNAVDGDGCSANCQSNETCGNGILDPTASESCDDGNTADGDGCSHRRQRGL